MQGEIHFEINQVVGDTEEIYLFVYLELSAHR